MHDIRQIDQKLRCGNIRLSPRIRSSLKQGVTRRDASRRRNSSGHDVKVMPIHGDASSKMSPINDVEWLIVLTGVQNDHECLFWQTISGESCKNDRICDINMYSVHS